MRLVNLPRHTDFLVFELMDWDCTDSEVVGPKAAVLAQSAQAGFRVPRAIIFPWSTLSTQSRPALLRTGLELLSPSTARLILRSSALSEDTATESGAGRFRSEFVMAEIDSLVESADAILEHAKSLGEDCCSLILQEVPEIAWGGVCFTQHPCVADEAVIYIEASSLGAEFVTRGERIEFTAVIERASPWKSFLRGSDTLTESMARQIGALATGLELIYASAQDVEWIIDSEGKLWLVQSRSISTTETCSRDSRDNTGRVRKSSSIKVVTI